MNLHSLLQIIWGKLFWKFSRLELAKRISFSVSVQLNGRRFKVPWVMGVGAANLYLGEMWMMRLLERIPLPTGGIFLDVGANIGQTLLKLKSCRPDLAWIGIEPNALCVAYLQQLIKANAFTDCTVLPIAIHTSDEIKVLEFYNSDRSDSAASMVDNFRSPEMVVDRAFIPVFSYRALEPFVPKDKVTFVKIDVEGGERDVLESIVPILTSSRPPVVCEVLPVYSPDNRSRLERQRALEGLFTSYQYCIYRIQKTLDGRFLSLLPIETIEVHGEIEWSDYLALPTERSVELTQVLLSANQTTAQRKM